MTANGEEYEADHVIVTVSLGILQNHMDTLFNPQLPEKKVNVIKVRFFFFLILQINDKKKL